MPENNTNCPVLLIGNRIWLKCTIIKNLMGDNSVISYHCNQPGIKVIFSATFIYFNRFLTI